MYIKCWGSRGSIPVSGKKYIKYGGDTTCIEIRTNSDDIIIIDAGTGIRRLGNYLSREGYSKFNLLFTHAHWDHLMGFPFFKPLYDKHTRIQIYRGPFVGKFVETMLSRVMAPPNFPVKYSDLKAKIVYKKTSSVKFTIGSITVETIPLSHPNSGIGYKFSENGRAFVFLTDNELGFVHSGGLEYREYLTFSKEADLLIHDAEYTPGEYGQFIEWGHSSYADTLRLAHEAGVDRLGLFHLNQERTDPEMDIIVGECNQIIEKEKYGFDCFGVAVDMEFTL